MERTASESERRPRQAERRDAGEGSGRANQRSGQVATLHEAAGNQAIKDLHERGELQAKLTVSDPSDATEREAERVADAVLGMDDPRSGESSGATVSRQTTGQGAGTVDGRTETQIRSLTSGGKPLPDSVRSFFEPRFDRGLSDVRIHTGPDADEAARSIDAEAFTLGSDIAFAKGKYRPGTRWGKQLLAHELAHVVQQGDHRRSIQRQETDESDDYRAYYEDGSGPRFFDTEEGVTFGYKQSGDQYVWKPPFTRSTAGTYSEAANILADYNDRLKDLYFEFGGLVVDDAETITAELRDEFVQKEGSIRLRDAKRLAEAAAYIYDAFDRTVGGKPEALRETLKEVTATDNVLDGLYRELSEKLHFAFVRGDQSASTLGTYLKGVKDMSSDIENIMEGARTLEEAIEGVDLPRFFSKIEKLNDKVKTIAEKASTVVDGIKLVFEWISDVPSEMFTMVNKVQTAVDTIDTVMDFVDVTIINKSFGKLWSGYYKPAIDQCVEGLRELTKASDVKARNLTYLLSSWGDPDSPESEPPQIPDGPKKYFPGGQPVLNFMWHAVHGRYQDPSPAAESFFEEHEDAIRALVPDDQSMFEIYSLVFRYSDLVWAMLYGQLPQKKGQV